MGVKRGMVFYEIDYLIMVLLLHEKHVILSNKPYVNFFKIPVLFILFLFSLILICMNLPQ